MILVLAGLFEIGWATGLKYTEGFTRPLATTITVIAMIMSMALLGLAFGISSYVTSLSLFEALSEVSAFVGVETLLLRAFPIRSCADTIFQNRSRPC